MIEKSEYYAVLLKIKISQMLLISVMVVQITKEVAA